VFRNCKVANFDCLITNLNVSSFTGYIEGVPYFSDKKSGVRNFAYLSGSFDRRTAYLKVNIAFPARPNGQVELEVSAKLSFRNISYVKVNHCKLCAVFAEIQIVMMSGFSVTVDIISCEFSFIRVRNVFKETEARVTVGNMSVSAIRSKNS